jgi:hypothetical protein
LTTLLSQVAQVVAEHLTTKQVLVVAEQAVYVQL